MIRIHAPLLCSFVLGIVANGCVVTQGADEGPSQQSTAPLLCSSGDYPEIYYRDEDRDGHALTTPTKFCTPPGPGWSDVPGDDCNDKDPTVYPGAPEIVGDGKDSNCDGKDPDGAGPVTNKYRVVSLRVFRMCDDEGGNCGTETKEQMQRAIDAANTYLYRSNSKLRYKLSDVTARVTVGLVSAAPFEYILSSHWNNDCRPSGGLAYVDHDANGDGKIDDADVKKLCADIPASRTFEIDFGAFQQLVEFQGDVPVIARNGFETVEWKDGRWQAKRISYGYSGCSKHSAVLNKEWGAGTFLAHELGHYLCLPHAMADGDDAPKSMAEAATMIKDHVSANGLSPSATTDIFRELWNNDWGTTQFTGPLSYIQMFPIDDTPADPGLKLWRVARGVPLDDASQDCTTEVDDIKVGVNYGGGVSPIYSIRPNRTNIMSYFKACFDAQQSFSADQVARMEKVGSSTGHRANVGKDAWVTGFNNTATVSIPPAILMQPKTWVGSSITATGSGPIKRVAIYINASNPGGIDAQLIAPGAIKPISIESLPADPYVKGIYYVDVSSLSKAGTWRLEVASAHVTPNPSTGKLYDWRLEFE